MLGFKIENDKDYRGGTESINVFLLFVYGCVMLGVKIEKEKDYRGGTESINVFFAQTHAAAGSHALPPTPFKQPQHTSPRTCPLVLPEAAAAAQIQQQPPCTRSHYQKDQPPPPPTCSTTKNVPHQEQKGGRQEG
jgi:hypothetical protein